MNLTKEEEDALFPPDNFGRNLNANFTFPLIPPPTITSCTLEDSLKKLEPTEQYVARLGMKSNLNLSRRTENEKSFHDDNKKTS